MSNDEILDLKTYADKMYLGYSVAVLKDRAIPYLNDSLKPVHRRILFAMKELNNLSTQKHKKSARIVGDVIGKYHPHGDSSVYDAMTRISQEWSLRYPLVDGQGNFGSRDGDRQAAMRYTEARLTPLAESALLSELGLGTVDYINNFDNTISEPSSLPSKLNLLLMNGATGIAVGMATDIPSHNIREVTDATIEIIKNSKISEEQIFEIIKGPDLPEGGQIISTKETIQDCYKTGRGLLRCRAIWHVEKLAGGAWQIVIDEFPPNRNAKKVLEDIAKTTSPQQTKDKSGKPKPLNSKALADKNFMLSILGRATDQSDRKVSVRFVLEPKSKKQDPEEFMNLLISRIGLEETIKVNLTTVGLDGLPKCKSLMEILREWIDYRFTTMTRRTNFQLDKVQQRIHTLEGRLIAFLNIDAFIKIIRESDTPKEIFIEKYGVSQKQAEDILEIKLRQLAKLEGVKIEKELEILRKEEKRLLILLNSKRKMLNLMQKEIELETIKFEDERRTLLKEEKVVVAKAEDTILNEAITIIYTKQGWLTARKGHDFDLSTVQLKTDDNILSVCEGRSVDNVCFIGSDGRSFSLRSNVIPTGKGSFLHYNTLFNLSTGVNIQHIIFGENDEESFLFVNNHGYGFISKVKSLVSKNKAGKGFMTLPKIDSKIFKPIKINNNKNIAVLTSDERLLIFKIDEIKELEKGKGIQFVKIVGNSEIKDIKIFNEKIKIKEKRKNIILNETDFDGFLGKRASRGRKVDKTTTFI
jgi:topoisomerase-4 subunit A